jgi:hypothetical protein
LNSPGGTPEVFAGVERPIRRQSEYVTLDSPPVIADRTGVFVAEHRAAADTEYPMPMIELGIPCLVEKHQQIVDFKDAASNSPLINDLGQLLARGELDTVPHVGLCLFQET